MEEWILEADQRSEADVIWLKPSTTDPFILIDELLRFFKHQRNRLRVLLEVLAGRGGGQDPGGRVCRLPRAGAHRGSAGQAGGRGRGK